MLPMIVTTCLAKGAVSMSREKTIVKNLNSHPEFRSHGRALHRQDRHADAGSRDAGIPSGCHGALRTRVYSRHAYLNSYFQTGYKNLMDLAIISRTEEEEAADARLVDLSENYVKVDEIPFDSFAAVLRLWYGTGRAKRRW